MGENNLYKPISVGRVNLEHRLVLAPLTRFRAEDDHSPNAMMTEYYRQRASIPGTLLITEATLPSERAGLMANVPGVWTEKHIKGWKEISDAVHSKGSSIFMQIWALGKAGSKKMLEERGYDYVAPSAVKPIMANVRTGEHETPRAMTKAEIKQFVQDFAQGAKNAVAAGMDGVEIHGAHGYLVNQFFDAFSNERTDEYGGSIENKCRFLFEVVDAVIDAIGADRTALRLSPWLNAMVCNYDISPIPIFSYIITELERRAQNGHRLAYLHIVEPRVEGTIDARKVVGSNDWVRYIWTGTIVRAGGYEKELAEQHAAQDDNTLIAFGRRYIPNPDLPVKIEKSIPLTPYNRKTFYSPGPEGYITYKPTANL
ncbi:hypothetical protein TRICI_002539 [Trichomonascus ciferrii]|uniref:NADH:flavin oxidoreductase/NADH oxidase N-terminal domain-containing protein n=1 Tax=Trichomonascus ciferrii TaxID=44093 RepID=A0A642V5N2_9ASCO|nr:hypothetical protein TRICI_002539 [Trichomonascus ciferrii]